MRFRYKRIFAVFLIPLGYLLTQLAKNVPHLVEKLYSQGVYPVLSQGISTITGLFSFSVAEVILYLLVFALIGALLYSTYIFFKNTRRYKEYMLGFLSNLIAAASIVYFVFVCLCGFNYNRYPFYHFAGLELRPRQASELAATTEYLMEQAVALRKSVTLNEQSLFAPSFTFEEAAEAAAEGMDKLSRKYPVLRGMYAPSKPVRLSGKIMSELNLCGFFFPFTYEANVNEGLLPSELLFTMFHEMAHVRGFMREGDANFISYLACLATKNADFMYAGTLHSLIYCLNALYKADPVLYVETVSSLDQGVSADISALNRYWAPYNGVASRFSNKINDTYLRVNNQLAGVRSYGDTVDSLIAYYKSISQVEPSGTEEGFL